MRTNLPIHDNTRDLGRALPTFELDHIVTRIRTSYRSLRRPSVQLELRGADQRHKSQLFRTNQNHPTSSPKSVIPKRRTIAGLNHGGTLPVYIRSKSRCRCVSVQAVAASPYWCVTRLLSRGAFVGKLLPPRIVPWRIPESQWFLVVRCVA